MSDRGSRKVLLLHPDDQNPRKPDWNLIVDLGRAPASTYDEWSQQAGCRVMSLFDLTKGVDDLRLTRELLDLGLGEVVDRFGIDWWDVLVQSIVPQIQQLILIRRLAALIPPGADLYSTRQHFLARALQVLIGGKLVIVQGGRHRLGRAVTHYVNALQQLDLTQLTQVIQDKFDSEHAVRRRLARRATTSGPVVLLPSAYVNVSRTAVAYAEMLPNVQFLLLLARKNGRLPTVPANVRSASLDGYFPGIDKSEQHSLKQAIGCLRLKLASSVLEFEMADASGLLTSLEARLSWGIAVRNAWNSVFESEAITACLCADDSNPYSRVPLILAKNRGIPALACHHGAMDSRMAIKKKHADFYLAKSEMERDYLARVCQVPGENIVTGAPQPPKALGLATNRMPSWLVVFTEPYHALGWHTGEIYRDLLPRLAALAEACRLELVFKLHPFESERGHRRILRRYLRMKAARETRVITGQTPPELWQNAACALTVQSTVALECAMRGVPLFLCGWLADSCAGYVQQYERFGVGRVLRSVEELDQIPRCIASQAIQQPYGLTETLDPKTLRHLLEGVYSRPALASA